MLFLTRRPEQSITIQPGQGLAAALPVGALFDSGPIVLQVNRINFDEVRMRPEHCRRDNVRKYSWGSIAAHRDLVILREELQLQPGTRLSVAAGGGREPGSVSNHSLSHLDTEHDDAGHPSSRSALARNVTRLCKAQQWPVMQLAEASELSLTTLRAIEQGTGLITLDDLDQLAAVFGVKSAVFLPDVP